MKTLFINSKVLVSSGNFAEALGFDSESGRVLFAGSNDEASASKREYDEVIDLAGRLVIPSFTDGHCHFIEGSYVNSQLDLRNASCRRDFEIAITEYRKSGKQWIIGGYFADSNITDGFLPDIDFLDSVCADVPLIVSRFDIHSAFANSLALKISGFDAAAEGFTDEEVIRRNGRLTGELKERAMDFVLDTIPEAGFDERLDAAVNQMKKLHSMGITAISDITLIPDLEIYKAMLDSGTLKLRVDARLRFTEFGNLEKIRQEFSAYHPQIKFDSLKAFYDGSLSSMTSYMHDNFKGFLHNGIRTEFVNSGEFEKYSFLLDEAGVQLSVHAIGDKSVTELLDLAVELNKYNGARDRRLRIEHAQHIQPRDFERFGELGVIASVQPSHLFSDSKTAGAILTDPSIGHNYSQLLKHGARICFGTDFPVVSESPFETIYYAMTRGDDNAVSSENIFSLEECLNAYTYENAYAVFEEDLRGTLEPGKIADVTVIDGDLFRMTPAEIRHAKVFATYFGGVRVYSA